MDGGRSRAARPASDPILSVIAGFVPHRGFGCPGRPHRLGTVGGDRLDFPPDRPQPAAAGDRSRSGPVRRLLEKKPRRPPTMDDSDTAARQAGRTPARLPFYRQLGRFFALTLRQSHEDAIYLTASALAFVTILSLVPLLAALSFVGTRVFSQYPEKSLEVFIQVLPYSEKTLTDKLREFLDQAETMHGVGLAALFGTTLLAFATIEETFNKIWNVSR